MRANFKLDNGKLVLTLDSISGHERTDAVDVELALLRSYGYSSSSWEWRKLMGVPIGQCVVVRNGSDDSDVAITKKVLSRFAL